MNSDASPTPPEVPSRAAMEAEIRRDIKGIAKQSCLVGVDAEHWDVTRISWTGEEWEGLRPHPAICYVEAFEHSNPPHDFIFVVSVSTGTPKHLASYEGDMDFFELTVAALEADALALPARIPR